MNTAVAGATGNIGTRVSAVLEREGRSVTPIARAHGTDLLSGEGVSAALRGVDTLIDVTNAAVDDPVSYFTTTTSNLLAAAAQAGVRHYVLLSILAVDKVEGNAHYAGKRAQEDLVSGGPVPWSIVRATQFHDFAAMVAGWSHTQGTASLAPLLVQPIDPGDVAEVLAEVSTGEPLSDRVNIAGPEPQDLVDMARRTHAARGQRLKLVPTWRGRFGLEMAGNVLLPDGDARIMPTTFDEWLTTQRPENTL